MSVVRSLRAYLAVVGLSFAAAPALAADAPPSARQIAPATKVFAAARLDRTMATAARAIGPTMAKQFDALAPQMTTA